MQKTRSASIYQCVFEMIGFLCFDIDKYFVGSLLVTFLN